MSDCCMCYVSQATEDDGLCLSCYNDLQLDKKPDPINSPPHYKFGDYELIDIIKAWSSDCGLTFSPGVCYQVFLWASMQQYLFRFPKKKGLQDLKKAEWYLQRLINEVGKESDE